MSVSTTSIEEINAFIDTYNDIETYPTMQDVAEAHDVSVKRAQNLIGELRRRRQDGETRISKIVSRIAAKKIDPAVREAMEAFDLNTEPDMIWFKNGDYSVKVSPEKVKEKTFMELIADAFEFIPPAPVIQKPKVSLKNLMTVYPFFDVHLGMKAHAEISGEDYDLEIARERVVNAMAEAMAAAPNSSRAIIINGGDFTHQTDDRNMTRGHGHILDVAGRNFPTVCEAVEVISHTIEMALTKHDIVEYVSVPGNHDPQNWETILLGLRERYRLNKRVIIHWNFKNNGAANEIAVFEHGEVAIFVHHGDKRTPKDLSMFCAAEFPGVWGRTKYRIVMTGHMHHIKTDEFPGIYWWQLPAFGPRDHHASGGYKSHSKMFAITFDHLSEKYRHTARL